MNFKLLLTLLAFLFTSSIAISQNYYLGTENGTTTCSTCHTKGNNISPIYDTWKYTAHATAYDSLKNHPGFGYSCLQCHTTGWNPDVNNYGADEFVKKDTTSALGYVITDQARWNRVKNVGCESCHGPLGTKDSLLSQDHWKFQSANKLNYSSEVCGKCHSGSHNPFYEEWSMSKHALTTSGSLAFVTKNKSCVRCHVAQNFILYSQDPAAYKDTILVTGNDIQPLTCVACHDPHEKKYTAQLRFAETSTRVICDECHSADIDSVNINSAPHHTTSEALSGSKLFGYQYPGHQYYNSAHTYAATHRCIDCHVDNSPDALGKANVGHTFEPRVQACKKCHDDYYSAVDTSNHSKMFDYRGVQTTTDSLINILSAKLSAASPSDSNTAAFKEADYNLLSVQADGSQGIHNTQLIQQLLKDAIAGFSPVTGISTEKGVPTKYSLSQNYPNPFNPTTTIKFSIAHGSNVKIVIYDAIGKAVSTLVDSYYAQGSYQVHWNASAYSSGVYFYRIEAKNFSMVKKMILMK